MNKKKQEKDFVIKYEFMPSEQSEIRLQRGFQIIFEKIIKAKELNGNNQKHLSMTG